MKLLEYCDVEGGSNRGESRPLWANLNGSHACVTTDAQHGVLSIREARRRRGRPACAGCGQGGEQATAGNRREMGQVRPEAIPQGAGQAVVTTRGGSRELSSRGARRRSGAGLGKLSSTGAGFRLFAGAPALYPHRGSHGDALKLPAHKVRPIRATQAEGLRWAATGEEGLRWARPQALQERPVGGGGSRKRRGQARKKSGGASSLCEGAPEEGSGRPWAPYRGSGLHRAQGPCVPRRSGRHHLARAAGHPPNSRHPRLARCRHASGVLLAGPLSDGGPPANEGQRSTQGPKSRARRRGSRLAPAGTAS